MSHLQKNQALLAASLDSVIKRPIAFGLIWEGITEGDIDKINRGNERFYENHNRPIIFRFIWGSSLSSSSYHHDHDYPFVLWVDPDLPSLVLVIIIITRPKPSYGRQGLAASWGQNTDQVGTLSGVLNVSLRASGAQLGYEPTWNHEKT